MRPADVVLVGGTVVDVLDGRTAVGDVAITGGRITAVGDVSGAIGEATELHDCSGRFVAPGFVEPHLHVAFSQVSIERLAELLLPMGTVAVSGCLSEAAAIVGMPAVREQLRRVDETGLDLLLSPFYVAALGPGPFGAQDLLELVRDDRCVELREWSDRVHRRLAPELREAHAEALRHGRVIAGHLQGQSVAELEASAALGVRSDHETTTVQEALERLRLGITVQIRQGSAGRDIDALLPAITAHSADPGGFAFCADEQELADLLAHGHLDGKLRVAVERGVAPLDALRMATLNAARSLGVEADYGAVAAGRIASLVVLEDLASFRVAMTFSHGRLVAAGGRYAGTISTEPYPSAWSDTIRVPRPFVADDFRLDLPDGHSDVRVVGVKPGRLRSDELVHTVDVVDGRLTGPRQGLATLAVAERLTGSGRLGVGLVHGLDVHHGAVASTVGPGFDLIVLGVDEEDMAVAANRVIDLHGGTAVVRDGTVRAEIALPLFGMVSHEPLERTSAAAMAVDAAVRTELGSSVEAVVPCAGFAALASIGDLKLTDAGLRRASVTGEPEPVALTAD